MSGFKVKPLTKKQPVDPAQLAAFANGADLPEVAALSPTPMPTKPNTEHKEKIVPWDKLDNKIRRTAFCMRFTAKELAMLKHIAATTPHSMHEFCLIAIQKALSKHPM